MRERRRARSLPAYPAALLESPGGPGGPGGPERKKSVKFADSLGLTLTRVKTFSTQEEPRVPSPVLSRHRSFPPVLPGFPGLPEPDRQLARLVPVFPELQDAERRAARLRVCLERVSVSQFDVRGHIRVSGGGTGRREVGVRYTFNDWLSHVDAQALAVPAEPLRFSFTVYTPPVMPPGAAVHLAVYLRAEHEDFWDNNDGLNYTFRYRRTVPEPPFTSAAFHAT